MKRGLALLVACAALAPVLAAQAATGTTARLRCATYNVGNFYDRYDDPYTEDSLLEKGTQPKSARALYAVARVLSAVNADVIALQEVENRPFLEEFNQTYLRALGYTQVILVEGNSSHLQGRGIDVAVLSRVPVGGVTTHQHRQFRNRKEVIGFSRDLLQVQLKPPGWPEINLFVVHAMSKLGGTYAEHRRMAEAGEASRILAESAGSGTGMWVIVAGDFNEKADEPSLRMYTGNPLCPLARLPAKDKDGGVFTWYPSARGDSPYEATTFDHILASPAVVAHCPSRQAVIYNEPAARGASDHRPVYIDIRK
ncbi:hypothetical protein GX586_05200 [bacterium]|nr:hypothetical protein [bacterium]